MNFDRITDAIRELQNQGLSCFQAKSGHWKVYNSRGDYVVTLSKNMNDARGWKNNVARIRRATGLRLR